MNSSSAGFALSENVLMRLPVSGNPVFLFDKRLQALLDLGLLADTVTQVIQLGAADFTAADGLDGDDGGRMHGEDLLAANVVADAADGDRLVDAAMLLGDDDALESLITLTASFLDTNGDANGVADVQLGQFGLHVLLGKGFDEIHDKSFLFLKAFIPWHTAQTGSGPS